MIQNPIRSRAVIVAFVSAFLAVSATVVSAQSAPEISYTVSMSKPSSHLIEVEMRLNWANLPNQAEVKMPVWTPGSYLIREYARHVQDFKASAGSRSLNWRKTNKNTWQIDTGGAKSITVNYKVYANELTVRTNELNYEHLFFTPAALLMFPKGQISQPSTVKVVPYGNWKVATGLPRVAGQQNTFRAANYDILYDSPFEVSDFVEKKFTVRGKEHRYVVTGEGNYDLDRMAEDTAKIVEESAKIFGELPYDDYLLILNLRGGGGLEHLNSTALQFNRWAFNSPQGYSGFLGLVAHEFFHLYNVKRIRPDALGPFDYENENYTKLLWVAEGTTSYYENLLKIRSGLTTAQGVLSSQASIIEGLYGQPGRFETSLEEASFDAWIKYYRQDENSINNQISYYSKGELVSFLLDIMIRSESNGEKSMDDVMRYLYNEFYKKNRNFSPEDFQRVCEMMARSSLDDFFSRYVRGRDEIDYDSILNRIGLQLVSSRSENDDAYLGANLSASGDALRVRSVPAGSPAWDAGLNVEDDIVAIDGFKISQQFLTFYLNSKKAGDKVTLSLFRHGKLMNMEVTLGRTPASGYAIRPVENPTEDQKRIYQGLFGSSLN
ncbi:MAG: M61 family metallopeptidase [Acidobacteriota bacterium]|nr:MAG: M61 family metallopeptidase [Acidobacteriota bacterium]